MGKRAFVVSISIHMYGVHIVLVFVFFLRFGLREAAGECGQSVRDR